MDPKRKIAVIWQTDYDCLRRVLRGVFSYADVNHWDMRFFEPRDTIHAIKWKADGFLVNAGQKKLPLAFKRLTSPMVAVPDPWNLPHLPGVAGDAVADGRLAARYFVDRGFRCFAFCGTTSADKPWAQGRQRGYEEELKTSGFTCALLPLPNGNDKKAENGVIRWLAQAPKQVAVFAMNDFTGHKLIRICHNANLHVPDHVAILGGDNDDLFCQLIRPMLSSVEVPWERMGMEAAQMLDQIIGGEPAPKERLLLPPLGVVTRQSSEVLAVSDPDLRLAIQFIRDHATESIGVEDVVAATHISRRRLEIRFEEFLGKTPLEEIRSTRLAKAKHLLAHSNLSTAEVALKSGFANNQRLCVCFSAETGMSPTAYRKRYGSKGTNQW